MPENTPLKVLVLGASGYIGQRLMKRLDASGWALATGAARHVPPSASGAPQARWLALDNRDGAALRTALQGQDAVVNCVAGDAASIAQGAHTLAQAALSCKRPPRWVHLSSQSVYGPASGCVNEDAPLNASLGWYGRAKCAAEDAVQAYAADSHGHAGNVRAQAGAVILRPGCVYGAGSQLWVGRVGRCLAARRLGDLGVAGDGYSNLVHTDDVCSAVLAALRLPLTGRQAAPAFNLAAPDSPRWNRYFIDLALAIGATPVDRLRHQIKLDAWLAGPPLKVAHILLRKLGIQTAALPDPLPPALLRLWQQHMLLDGSAAVHDLGLRYTPYAQGLAESAAWFAQAHAKPTGAQGVRGRA